ncbi:methyltransferase [Phenylobacterium sp.]|uniref:class I SAM-dependent methyltransferase n=1 Tax=Phenylobacterium sp. TaxID=1871053 RepID=UPI00286BC5B7|nr:methyltransferase [Phenylobacterium sp.]
MTRKRIVLILSALSLAVATLGAASGAFAGLPANLSAAVADKARPAGDVARDTARKPAELLAFAEVKPGQSVADFMMGGGYFTRILAAAVGPTGKVYAYQSAEFIKFRAAYGTEQSTAVADYKNAVALTGPLSATGLPAGLDLVLTVQNYHDLHLKPFPAGTAASVNAQIFKALKPGGLYVVVDHAAAVGAPVEVADSLHRIDPAVVRTEVEAAGFKLAAEDAMLANPEDPHSANVFSPAIRGKTDQFVLKFRKPK